MHPFLPHHKEDRFSKKKNTPNLIQIVDQIYFLPNLLVASVSLHQMLLHRKDGSSPTVLQWQDCQCLVFLKHRQTSRAYPLCLTPSLFMHLHHTIEFFFSLSSTFAKSTLDLDLFANLSCYSFLQQSTSQLSIVPSAPRQHHMVLHPRQNRYAHLSLISTTLLSLASSVTSSSNLEPLSFKKAYQLMC